MTVQDIKVEISLVLTDSFKSEHSVTCLSQFAQQYLPQWNIKIINVLLLINLAKSGWE